MPFFIDTSYSSKLEDLSLIDVLRVQKEVCFEEAHVTFLFQTSVWNLVSVSFTLFKGQLRKTEKFLSVLLVYEKQYELI